MAKDTEFRYGMRVSMPGRGKKVETGTVVDAYGVIRWDTDRCEEDWTGMFGSFIQNGGKVLEEKGGPA